MQTYKDLNEAFVESLKTLNEECTIVNSRGTKQREVLWHSLKISDPTALSIEVPARKFKNPPILERKCSLERSRASKISPRYTLHSNLKFSSTFFFNLPMGHFFAAGSTCKNSCCFVHPISVSLLSKLALMEASRPSISWRATSTNHSLPAFAAGKDIGLLNHLNDC